MPFDPTRAWTLIERLRADLAAAKATPAPPTAPAEPASAEPPASGVPDSGEVERLRVELTRERVARRFGLDDALTDLLGTGDEPTITARAELLAERLAHPDPAPSVSRRPVERLRGGGDPTTPAEAEETDPAKLAARVRRY